jgi:hypothetical protein
MLRMCGKWQEEQKVGTCWLLCARCNEFDFKRQVLVQEGPQSGLAVQRKAVTWTLTTSAYFKRRKNEAESRDFGDMQNIYRQQFDVDWARVACKERFMAMIARSDRTLLATDREALQKGTLQSVRKAFSLRDPHLDWGQHCRVARRWCLSIHKHL